MRVFGYRRGRAQRPPGTRSGRRAELPGGCAVSPRCRSGPPSGHPYPVEAMHADDAPSAPGEPPRPDGLTTYLAAHEYVGEFRETWAGVPLRFRLALSRTEPHRAWVGSARAVVFRGSQVLIVADGAGLLVGGRLEPGETLHAALVREVAEETGWTVTPGPVFAFWHGRNLGGTPPAGWGRPDPDFIDPVYAVEATAFDAAARLDGNPCEFIEIGEALRRLEGLLHRLLELAVAARAGPGSATTA
jgi:8-oxo-dGTP pyrophosphatase MutT (NUDIX family)